MTEKSIFIEYYQEVDFIDRKIKNNEEGVDVIIPLINTNPLFEKNLNSFYKEVPIERLIIGDGGCTDNTIEIAKKFPRVEIIDQSHYNSQGICIAELISKVKTKWFIYFHADVYLPPGWYDSMIKFQSNYDFFECNRKYTILLEYFHKDLEKVERALSGSQMGRTEAFKDIWPLIEDGYLQRNEDLIFKDLIIQKGFKYGRIFDTFHYHQVMNRRGELEPNFTRVKLEKEVNKDWEIKIHTIQIRGLIKYCSPQLLFVNNVNMSLQRLIKYDAINIPEFKKWVKKTNVEWMKFIKFKKSILERISLKWKLIFFLIGTIAIITTLGNTNFLNGWEKQLPMSWPE